MYIMRVCIISIAKCEKTDVGQTKKEGTKTDLGRREYISWGKMPVLISFFCIGS